MFFGLEKFFHSPLVLLGVLFVPFILFWCAFVIERRRKILLQFTKEAPNVIASRCQLLFIGLGLVLLIVACARPRWGKATDMVLTFDRNIVVAIDVSRSMLANDVYPNRLERVKADVLDFISSLKGERCSIVAFRRTGVSLSPLTTDQGYLRSIINALDIESAPEGETDLSSAIRESLRIISQDAGKNGEKATSSAIVLISDGGNLRGDILKEAQRAKELGVSIYTIGVGSPHKGSLIPISEGRFLQHKGKNVEVKLEEDVLRQIADITGGCYMPLISSEGEQPVLASVYEKILRGVEANEKAEENGMLKERYEYFLATAIVLLLASACLSKGRFRTTKKH